MKKLSLLICLLLSFVCMAQEKSWIEQKFGKEFVDAQGKKHKTSELKGKMVGIYFSAHWCPPCRAFTPKLVEFRNACAKENFEIVFVSCDKDQKAMEGYMKETKMKWLAMPFDSPTRKQLMKDFSVSGIPYLVVLDKDGKVISTNARSEVTNEGTKALKKWRKQ